MRLALILLAAGDSRRFHGNKLLSEFYGKPMYQYIVKEVEKLPEDLFEKRLIVTQYGEIMEYMKKQGWQVVENKKSHLGISHSIHLAIGAVREEEEPMACCFGVCDQPYLKADTLKGLITGWKNSKKGIGCLCSGGEPGNPVVFSPRYQKELLGLSGDMGGKRIVRQHMDDLFLYEVEDGRELADIDVPLDEEPLE